MPTAHVDIAVSRHALAVPVARLEIRMRLYQAAVAEFGRVRQIRYLRDPLDGPLAEQGLPTEETAIVRAIVDVAR